MEDCTYREDVPFVISECFGGELFFDGCEEGEGFVFCGIGWYWNVVAGHRVSFKLWGCGSSCSMLLVGNYVIIFAKRKEPLTGACSTRVRFSGVPVAPSRKTVASFGSLT